MSLENFNKLGALRAMKNNNIVYGSSHGTCAKSVRLFLESGGINTAGHPVAASGYLTYLPKIGFNAITTISGKKNLADWSKNHALVGDIAVMKHGKYGHICMWDGKLWVSDFKQKNANPYKEDVKITIFRHNSTAPEEEETSGGFNFDWNAFDFSGNGKNLFNPFDYNLWQENGSKTDLPIFSKRGSKLIKKKKIHRINKSDGRDNTELYLIPDPSIDINESTDNNTDSYYSLALIDRGWKYDPSEKKYTYALPNGTVVSTYDPVSHIFTGIDKDGLETLYPVAPRGENATDVFYAGNTPIGSFGTVEKDQYTMSDLDQAMKDAIAKGHSNLTITTTKGISEEELNKIIEAAERYGLHIKEFKLHIPEGGGIIGDAHLTPIDNDFNYARENIPAAVASPEKYHDPNITDLFFKEHYGATNMSLQAYTDYALTLKNRENEMMGIAATSLIGAAADPLVTAALSRIGGVLGKTGGVLEKGVGAIVKPLLNPGGEIVDKFVINTGKQLAKLVEKYPFLAKNAKYANLTKWVKDLDLGVDIMGATTTPGQWVNTGMAAYFGAEAGKALWDQGLNWETGTNATLALGLPLAGAAIGGIPYMMQDAERTYNAIPWKYRHPIKWVNKKINLSTRWKNYKKEVANLDMATRAAVDSQKIQEYYKKQIDKVESELKRKQKELCDKYGDIYSTIYAGGVLARGILDLKLRRNPYVVSQDLTEFTLLARELGLIDDTQKITIDPSGKFYVVSSLSGEKMYFNTISGGEIPVLSQSGQVIGKHRVEIKAEKGSFTPSEEYRKVTADNIKALEAMFPGTKAFGASTGVSKLGIPHYTCDFDLLITEEDAAKIPGLREMKFNDNGYTKTVGIDKNGNIVSTASPECVYKVDFNIVAQDANGKAKGPLAEELFRLFYPKECSDAFANQFLNDSHRLEIDIPYTPKELIDSVDPVMKTILDAHEIDFLAKSDPKHTARILNYLRTSLDQDKISAAIDLIALQIDPSGQWRPPRFAFDNPEENEEILQEMELSVDDATIHNPKAMLNLFDYWILDRLTQRRGIYNSPERTGIDFNDPNLSMEERWELLHSAYNYNRSIGLRAETQGLNSGQGGTSGRVGSGRGGKGESFDIIGTSTTKVNWDGVNTPHETILRAYYVTGSPEYEGEWPDIFEGMTPYDWAHAHNYMSDEEWRKFGEAIQKYGINAITEANGNNYRFGPFRTITDNGATEPVYNFLRTWMYPLRDRLNKGRLLFASGEFAINFGNSKFNIPLKYVLQKASDGKIVLTVPHNDNLSDEEIAQKINEMTRDRRELNQAMSKVGDATGNLLDRRFTPVDMILLKLEHRRRIKARKLRKEERNLVDNLTHESYAKKDKILIKYEEWRINAKKRQEKMEEKLGKAIDTQDKVKTAAIIGGVLAALVGGGIALNNAADKRIYSNIMKDKIRGRETNVLASGEFEDYLNSIDESKLDNTQIYALNIKRKQLEYYKQTGEWKSAEDFIESKRKGGKLIPRKFKVIK